jgi:peptide/nickel transport system substrate-binding protein
VRPLRRLAALLLVCAALAACTKAGQVAGPAGELRIGLNINPLNLNPILQENTNENFVDGLIFDELVTQDAQHHQIPDLAAVVPTVANGGISKDGLTITYHLRHGVKWQDGTPFTSKDVKFTWQAIMNSANNVPSRHGYDLISSIDTPDDYTVVMHFKRLFAPAIDTVFGESDTPFRVLPAHLLAKYPNLNQIPFNAAPVGTGPYRFARWLRGDRIILEANPNYFRGAPKLRQLTLLIVPDGNTEDSLVQTHELDLGIELTGVQYHDLANATGVVRQLVEAPVYDSVIFNTQRPPLDDVRVRRALVMGIDRAAIVRDDTYGAGEIAVGDLSPFYWAFDRSLHPIPYDPARARALLDAAGWRAGARGVRTKNGRPLSLQLVYGQGSQLAQTISVQVESMLKSIGVQLQLKSYPYDMLYAASQDGGIFLGGKYDLGFYAWISGADPDDSSQWSCSEIPPAGNNVTRYCSAAMDAAQRLALSTFDRSVRKKAYARIEALLLQDAPAAFLFYRKLPYARVPELQHFEPNGVSEGWNAQEWSR